MNEHLSLAFLLLGSKGMTPSPVISSGFFQALIGSCYSIPLSHKVRHRPTCYGVLGDAEVMGPESMTETLHSFRVVQHHIQFGIQEKAPGLAFAEPTDRAWSSTRINFECIIR